MAIRPRSAGEILDGAFRLYVQDIGLYTSTAIVASIPVALMMLVSLLSGGSTTSVFTVLALAPIALAATVSIWTALLVQMNDRLEGREPQLGPSVRRALALLLRVVWAGIIVYFLLAVSLAAWAVTAGVVVGLLGTFLPGIAPIVGMIAVVALGAVVFAGVLPGIALFLPGIALEGRTAYEAVKRGFQLAKGARGRILLVLFIAWLLVLALIVGVYFVTGTASMLVDPEATASGTISMGRFVLQQLLLLVVGGFTTPYVVACILLLYFDQRIRREAYDLQAEAEALAG